MNRRSRREAVYALAVIVGLGLFFVAAGTVMTDMAFALGLTMTMRGFWLTLHDSADKRGREQFLFFVGIAVGIAGEGAAYAGARRHSHRGVDAHDAPVRRGS